MIDERFGFTYTLQTVGGRKRPPPSTEIPKPGLLSLSPSFSVFLTVLHITGVAQLLLLTTP
jgi:hypothetical protein